MARKPGEHYEDREQEEYRDYLRQLVDNGDIEGAAAGIARLVIDKGKSDLTERQRYVFEHSVETAFPQPACGQCGELIPWEDAYRFIHADSLCSSCQHSYDRFTEET